MKIKVKKSHITKGQPGSNDACPIACAIKETFHIDNISVGCSTFSFLSSDGKGKRIKLPAAARKFIEKFDNENPVRPFEFEI